MNGGIIGLFYFGVKEKCAARNSFGENSPSQLLSMPFGGVYIIRPYEINRASQFDQGGNLRVGLFVDPPSLKLWRDKLRPFKHQRPRLYLVLCRARPPGGPLGCHVFTLRLEPCAIFIEDHKSRQPTD